MCNYSTSLHSIIVGRVNFRPVFRPLFSTTCFGRVAFGELFLTSFQHTWENAYLANHCLTIWMQICYHSLLWGDKIRKGADFEKRNCSFGVHPEQLGKLPIFLSFDLDCQIFKLI